MTNKKLTENCNFFIQTRDNGVLHEAGFELILQRMC